MKNKKIDFVSVVFYVFAVLALLYFIWAIFGAHSYIQDGIKTGQMTIKGNEFNVYGFYMSNSGIYLVYSFILFGIGEVIRRISTIEQKAVLIGKVEHKKNQD